MMERMGLKLETSASSTESGEGGSVGKAAKMQEKLFMQAVAECTDFPSFTKRLYPCWVLSLTNLAAFSELPEHEDALEVLEEQVAQRPDSDRFHRLVFQLEELNECFHPPMRV